MKNLADRISRLECLMLQLVQYQLDQSVHQIPRLDQIEKELIEALEAPEHKGYAQVS